MRETTKRELLFCYLDQEKKRSIKNDNKDLFWIKKAIELNKALYYVDRSLTPYNKEKNGYFSLDFLQLILYETKPPFLRDFFKQNLSKHPVDKEISLFSDFDLEPEHYENYGYLIMQLYFSYSNIDIEEFLRNNNISKLKNNKYLFNDTGDTYHIRDYGIFYNSENNNEKTFIQQYSNDYYFNLKYTIFGKYIEHLGLKYFLHILINEKELFREYENIEDLKEHIKLNYVI